MAIEQPNEESLREEAKLNRFKQRARVGLEDLIDFLWGLEDGYFTANPLVLDPSTFFRGRARSLERLTRLEQRALGQVLIDRLYLRDTLSLSFVREYETTGGQTLSERGNGLITVNVHRSRLALTGDEYQPSYLDERGMTIDTEGMDEDQLRGARILHMHRIVYSDRRVAYAIGPDTNID